MVLPHETGDRLTLDQAGMSVLVSLSQSSVLLLLVHGDRFPGFGEAATHKEDVSRLELNLAFGRNLLDFLECDCVAVHTVDFNTCASKRQHISSVPN